LGEDIWLSNITTQQPGAGEMDMKFHFMVLGLVLIVGLCASAETDIRMTDSDWNGYVKLSFIFEGKPAFVVKPKVAAPGKPWVWRMSFPDFHAEVDKELLRCGYHVAYIDCVDMLGCDEALGIMEKFRGFLLSNWNLSNKCALEAVSRGGLPAYRYAARHPGEIACIYADTPVMDLKSWPLKRHDVVQQVKAAIACYGFNDEAGLKAFKGNPLDLLAPIAEAKIPIRHVVSLNDKVVPPEENTFEAQRRFEKMGHEIDIVAVKEGNECGGHHFPLPEVFLSARFIMRHTDILPGGREYFTLRDGFSNCFSKFISQEKGRVVFLGGSITSNGGWRDETMRYLKMCFPKTKFEFIAAGIPSVGSTGHAFRMERDVLSGGPVDLIFVEAAVNDSTNIPDNPELMLRGMEGVIRRIVETNPFCDIVQLHFAMPMHIDDYSNKRVPVSIAQHERVAEHYKCNSLNLSLEVHDRIEAGEFGWESDFRDLHPSPYGQRVYANSIARMLDIGRHALSVEPVVHVLPEEMLDTASYFKGRFGPLENAKIITGFTLNPRWNPSDGKECRAGFVNVPALVASSAGAEFCYEWEGTAFGLFLAAGPKTGIIEFSIDGGKFKKMDTWTRWSGSLHLPWPVILADGLEDGKHEAVIRTATSADNRNSLNVIHILLN